MSGKAFDIIVYGSTGFTGRLMAKYIHLQDIDIKWAIAGRSQSKLSSLKAELINMRLTRNLPDILLADATDYRALCDMFSEASIVLNCTGPFRFLGKEVVEACLKAKCTYMDVCGEPQFMESCMLNCHDRALESNVLIIHACGFDSVPADLGVLYTLRQFPPGRCNSVESFLSVDCPKGLKHHYTTYACAAHGAGDVSAAKEVRKNIKTKYKHKDVIYYGPSLKKSSSYAFEKRLQKYVIPFQGADPLVVRSSQRSLSMRMEQYYWPQYNAYTTLNTAYNAAATSLYGTVFSSLAASPWGRSLLMAYPETFADGVFSKEGPTQEHLDTTTFQMHLFGKGFSRPYGVPPPSSEATGSRNSNTGTVEEEEEEKVGFENGHHNHGDNNNNNNNQNGNDHHSNGTRDSVALEESHSSSIDFTSDDGQRVVTKDSMDKEQGLGLGLESGSGQDSSGVTGDGVGVGVVPTLTTHISTTHTNNTTRGGDRVIIPKSEISSTTSFAKACSLPGIFRNVFSSSNHSTGGLEEPPEVPDKEVHVMVSGAEPGYVATPAIFFAMALCVLEERGRMPTGGVLTPASAFYDVPSIFDRLALAGVSFEVVADYATTNNQNQGGMGLLEHPHQGGNNSNLLMGNGDEGNDVDAQVEETMGELHIATALVKSPVGMMMSSGSGRGTSGGVRGLVHPDSDDAYVLASMGVGLPPAAIANPSTPTLTPVLIPAVEETLP